MAVIPRLGGSLYVAAADPLNSRVMLHCLDHATTRRSRLFQILSQVGRYDRDTAINATPGSDVSLIGELALIHDRLNR
jgi:hypothetical protein